MSWPFPQSIPDFAHNIMIASNLAGQFILIGLIVLAIHYKNQGKLRLHGNLVLLAVLIQFGFIFMHMGPSLLGDVGRDIAANPVAIVPLLSYAHSIIAAITVLMASWLTIAWASGYRIPPYCYGKGRLMKIIYALWITSLALGIVLFIFHIYIYPG